MPITVISSITGGKDSFIENQTRGGAAWLMYTDVPLQSKVWSTLPAYDKFSDTRRNSRVPKLLSHQFCDTEYSIWIDGNMSLLKTPEYIIEKYLSDSDIAVFGHNLRDCIYDEAKKCAVARLDEPETIIEQVVSYEKKGYAKHKGLGECGVILRRHTPRVVEFNNYWWSEYCRFSNRDQISFMFAADSVGLKVKFLDMQWRLSTDGLSAFRGDFIQMWPHIISNPVVV